MSRRPYKHRQSLAQRLSPFLNYDPDLKVLRAVKGSYAYLAHYSNQHLIRFDFVLECLVNCPFKDIQSTLAKHGFTFSWVPWKPSL